MAWSTLSFATGATKNGFAVDIDFQLAGPHTSFQSKKHSIIAEDNNSWTPLCPATAGIALLGRLHKPENEAVQMEFMIVDTSVEPVEVSQMSTITNLNKSAVISFTDDRGQFSVGLVATKTTFTEKAKSGASNKTKRPECYGHEKVPPEGCDVNDL